MEKRIYRKTGEAVSLLGYGMMRLPKVCPEKDDISYEKALALVDRAYQSGINYFDTAYMYHGGKSETFVGEALSRYPRGSFFLADKMPGWMLGEGGLARAKEIFAEQLTKCRTPYFDFYLCHSLNRRNAFEETYLKGGVLAYLEEEQRAGRIRHLGFSFHGDAAFFRYLMELRKWDFCQIQLNYLDWDRQNAKELYRMAEENGTQLIIMEPVRGGTLAVLCDEAQEILRKAEPERSIASWAIRFAASQPNVLCVLSGMSDAVQVEDNLRTLSDFQPISQAESKVLSAAIAAYSRRATIPCTACHYCYECPQGIAIPEIFAVYNEAAAQDRLPSSVGLSAEEQKRRAEAFLASYDQIPQDRQAHNCISCEACEKHCPQKIPVSDRIHEIAALAAGLR